MRFEIIWALVFRFFLSMLYNQGLFELYLYVYAFTTFGSFRPTDVILNCSHIGCVQFAETTSRTNVRFFTAHKFLNDIDNAPTNHIKSRKILSFLSYLQNREKRLRIGWTTMANFENAIATVALEHVLLDTLELLFSIFEASGKGKCGSACEMLAEPFIVHWNDTFCFWWAL